MPCVLSCPPFITESTGTEQMEGGSGARKETRKGLLEDVEGEGPANLAGGKNEA